MVTDAVLRTTFTQKFGDLPSRSPGHVDFSIVFGRRTLEEQANLYARGRTVPGDIVTWAAPGESRHNDEPSTAFDFAPWPEMYDASTWQFGLICGVLWKCAINRGIEIEFLSEKGDYGHVQIRQS
jgi:hypothetical protein